MQIELSIRTRLVSLPPHPRRTAILERHRLSLERVRHAVRTSQYAGQLCSWIESRVRLALVVQFHLARDAVANTQIDSLLPDLVRAVVEGAEGISEQDMAALPRAAEALFWQVVASKREAADEKIVVRIAPL